MSPCQSVVHIWLFTFSVVLNYIFLLVTCSSLLKPAINYAEDSEGEVLVGLKMFMWLINVFLNKKKRKRNTDQAEQNRRVSMWVEANSVYQYFIECKWPWYISWKGKVTQSLCLLKSVFILSKWRKIMARPVNTSPGTRWGWAGVRQVRLWGREYQRWKGNSISIKISTPGAVIILNLAPQKNTQFHKCKAKLDRIKRNRPQNHEIFDRSLP